MKKHLTSVFYIGLAALLGLVMTYQSMAQAPAAPGLTADKAKAAKAVKIPNLDKDTYVKISGFILERYEDRPAYVFNYTDGIVRKIYLYKLFDAASTTELGLVAYYVNGKTKDIKSFVIPGAKADRGAWDAYIDDLKYIGEKEPGLMSTLTFVLSRELTMLLSGEKTTADDGSKKKEEYNFCFAADAPVTLADGSVRAISELRIGDLVKSRDVATQTIIASPITRIDTHSGTENGFALTGVWLEPTQELTAGLTKPAAPTLLEATANHPALTTTGRKALGDVKPGELLYRYEAATNTVTTCRVVRVETAHRTVNTVYNLVTAAGSYMVANQVVLDK